MASELQKTDITNRKLCLQCSGDLVSGAPIQLSIDKWYKLFSEASWTYKGRNPGRQTASEAKAGEVERVSFEIQERQQTICPARQFREVSFDSTHNSAK
jgi:hypothetical protein